MTFHILSCCHGRVEKSSTLINKNSLTLVRITTRKPNLASQKRYYLFDNTNKFQIYVGIVYRVWSFNQLFINAKTRHSLACGLISRLCYDQPKSWLTNMKHILTSIYTLTPKHSNNHFMVVALISQAGRTQKKIVQ